MTITLNGTTGITTPTDTATTSVTTPVLTSPTATALTIQSAGTTAMTVDTSQNVGIGTTSPTAGGKLDVNGISYFGTGDKLKLYSNNLLQNAGTLDIGTIGSAALIFDTANTERARIDSSGNLLLNTTTSPTYAIQTGTTKNGTSNVQWEWGPSIIASTAPFYVVPHSGTNGVYIVSSATSWSSNSDERLKNITGTIDNALPSIKSLRAIKYTWKSDENNVSNVGLIAQDVLAVLPEAITEDRGFYGVKYTEVIPLLVAAMQELSAKNDALEARLAALEAK